MPFPHAYMMPQSYIAEMKLIENQTKSVNNVDNLNELEEDILVRIERFRGDWSDGELIHDAAMDAADEILRLSELLTKMIEADSAIYSAEDDYVGDVIGKFADVHFKEYSKAKKYMANV